MEPREVNEINDYIGKLPFGVFIDYSEELNNLTTIARDHRDLGYNDKLDKIKKLVLGSMENAYEGMHTDPDPERRQLFQSIVMEYHPLSDALKEKAGCCRYQGVLFFLLGYEAELGSKQFLRSATVKGSLHTVFNDLYDEGGDLNRINIFTESLKDKRFDYSKINPRVYENIDTYIPGVWFFFYYKKSGVPVLVESLGSPIDVNELV